MDDENGNRQRENLETILDNDPESKALSPENQEDQPHHSRQESSATSVSVSDPAWSSGFAPGELGMYDLDYFLNISTYVDCSRGSP